MAPITRLPIAFTASVPQGKAGPSSSIASIEVR